MLDDIDARWRGSEARRLRDGHEWLLIFSTLVLTFTMYLILPFSCFRQNVASQKIKINQQKAKNSPLYLVSRISEINE